MCDDDAEAKRKTIIGRPATPCSFDLANTLVKFISQGKLSIVNIIDI